MPAAQERKPGLKLHKRFDRYITAIFKLGRTEWQAKHALRRCAELDARLAEMDARYAALQSELQEAFSGAARLGQTLSHLEAVHEERFATAFSKLDQLDQYELQTGQALRQCVELEDRCDGIEQELRRAFSGATSVDQSLAKFEVQQKERLGLQKEHYKAGLATISRSLSDMTARLDRLMMRETTGKTNHQDPRSGLPDAEGLKAFQAQFYRQLENSRDDQRAERFKIYLPQVEAAVTRTDGKPVMDLGCGDGAWVSLLSSRGTPAFGIDTNSARVAEGVERGLDLREGDAVSALTEAETGSLSVVSAHHLIEHLSFETAAWIVREAVRVLAPGGILLFEIPNGANALAGQFPCHTAPVSQGRSTDHVFRVLFETAGFHPVELRHLNSHEQLDTVLSQSDVNHDLALLLFGPQDVAIFGTKPEKD